MLSNEEDDGEDECCTFVFLLFLLSILNFAKLHIFIFDDDEVDFLLLLILL